MIPQTFAQWESLLVAHFLKVGPAGDASPVRTFEITGATLTAAVGAKASEEQAVVEAFRTLFREDPLLSLALTDGYVARELEGLPGFFCYLALSIHIDSLIDGQYSAHGAYRSKLEAWLGNTRTYSNLRGIALLWERLASWLKKPQAKRQGLREIILPTGRPHWTHIGYPRQLSFPNKQDLLLLRNFVALCPSAADDVAKVVHYFDQFEAGWPLSEGLSDAYHDFRSLYLDHRLALANHRFWKLLARARNVIQIEDLSDQYLVELFYPEPDQVEVFVENGRGDRCAWESIDAILRDVGIASSPTLKHSVLSGVLLFEPIGMARWRSMVGVRVLPRQAVVAFERQRWNALDREGVGIYKRGNWGISSAPIARATLQRLLDHFGVRSKLGAGIFQPMALGGVRVGTAWLGRPNCLPNVVADTRDLEVEFDGEKDLLTIDNGVLVAKQAVEGVASVSPTAKANWTIQIRLKKNALPLLPNQNNRHRLEPLFDWRPLDSPEEVTAGVSPSVQWDSSSPWVDDLLEVIYADGHGGWQEEELLALIYRSANGRNPWSLLGWLRDSNILQPRLRSRWRGRDWTLVPPALRRIASDGQNYVLLEGATCTQQRHDFKTYVKNQGGQAFSFSPSTIECVPIVGAIGCDHAKAVQTFEWLSTPEPLTIPFGEAMRLPMSERRGEGYEKHLAWDWDRGRFEKHQFHQKGRPELTWMRHPTLRDHDIFVVSDRRRQSIFVSKTAAVLHAHSVARTPVFKIQLGMLVPLLDGCFLPDLLARHVRRAYLGMCGFNSEGRYVYDIPPKALTWLQHVLPGCVAPESEDTSLTAVTGRSRADRTGWRARPVWTGAELQWN